MSAATTPQPRRRPLLWGGLGTAVAVGLSACAVAFWPVSETDKARADGENVGAAVADLRTAESTDDVHDALDDLGGALHDTREHAGDALYDQVDAQGDAVYHAVNGYVGTLSSDDEWESDLYEEELETAVEDLNSQADEFRTNGPEVQQAFWEGVDSGLSGD